MSLSFSIYIIKKKEEKGRYTRRVLGRGWQDMGHHTAAVTIYISHCYLRLAFEAIQALLQCENDDWGGWRWPTRKSTLSGLKTAFSI